MVYALGGGRGHLTRALNLRAHLGAATILHQAGPWPQTISLGPCTPADLEPYLRGADRLVVDTFPGGIAHELKDLPDRSVLIARYVQRENYADYDALAARFSEVWLPYDEAESEWDDPPPGTWIGPVRRTLEWGSAADLVVIGSGEPPSWTPLLEGATRIDGPFQSLPRAKAIVALQCGYNLFWELHGCGIPTAFRPLARRFDDQFRRAGRFGTPLLHRRDLVDFLHLVRCGP